MRPFVLIACATLVTALSSPAQSGCPDAAFDDVRAILGPSGRVEVATSTSSARVEAYQDGRVVWAGRVATTDCSVVAEVAQIRVERALGTVSALPAGRIPRITIDTPPPTRVLTEPAWAVEIGVLGQWDTVASRIGAGLDGVVRRGPWAARAEIGGFVPRNEGFGAGVESEFVTVHSILSAEGCSAITESTRACLSLGGGLEWIRAEATGSPLFGAEPRSRVSSRVDGALRFGWFTDSWGLSGVVGGHFRPSPTTFQIEGIDTQAGLDRWALTGSVRAFFRFDPR